MRHVSPLLLAFTAAWVSASASAHTLDVSTSKVALRDDHVEISAEWDVFLLLAGSPTALATASDDELARARAALVTTIEAETHLAIDGTERHLTARGIPEGAELRALAAQLSASGHDHGSLVRFRLEAAGEARSPHRITVASPAKLGPVLTSFVQPQMRFAQPAEVASFEVLGPPVPAVSEGGGGSKPALSPGPVDASRWPLVAGLSLALMGGLSALRARTNQKRTS